MNFCKLVLDSLKIIFERAHAEKLDGINRITKFVRS